MATQAGWMGKMTGWIPEHVKNTAFVRTFGLTQVPMILYCSPSVIELNHTRCEIKIPLNWRTRNHLKSMYFGTLAVGADLAGGMIAMRIIGDLGNQVNLVFKDFQAEFLKRPEGDVHFSCEDGPACKALVEEAIRTGERVNTTVHVTATVPSLFGSEPVAKFKLTLSLKKKKKKE